MDIETLRNAKAWRIFALAAALAASVAMGLASWGQSLVRKDAELENEITAAKTLIDSEQERRRELGMAVQDINRKLDRILERVTGTKQ